MKQELNMINIPVWKDWYWTKIIMPNHLMRVFTYFYGKEEQPTYEEAEKELWIVKSCIYSHIKKFEKIWLCKVGKRWIISWNI